jgi:hypothetical protein
VSNADRGVSEVVGYVLVISLVLTTVGIVAVSGLGELRDARAAEQFNNAERAFDLLANNLDDVALRGAPSRSTEVNLDNARIAVANPIEVGIRGIDNSNTSNDVSENYSIWPIRYEADFSSAELIYVGGAVIRSPGGIILRETAMVEESNRSAIPIIKTRTRAAQSQAGGTVQIRADHGTTTLPVFDQAGTFDTVFVNVTSPRAAAWQTILDERDAFDCTVDPSGTTDRVWCKSRAPERVSISLIQVDMILTR